MLQLLHRKQARHFHHLHHPQIQSDQAFTKVFIIQLVEKYAKNSAKPFQHLTTLQQY